MKIAKEFRWEMGHRLPFHEDKCKHLHGHSYKLMVEFEGSLDTNGMVMDYYDVKKVVGPIIDNLDHSFIVCKNDIELIESLKSLNSKHVIIDYDSTAENLCGYFLNEISSAKLPENITKVNVKVFETETTYAEDEKEL